MSWEIWGFFSVAWFGLGVLTGVILTIGAEDINRWLGKWFL